MDPSQYAELFLAESREHLNEVNQQLLEWEHDPEATEPVDGIFRAVHTIKGMAATMGYAAVSDLAHRMENLLDILRGGEQHVTEEVFELLFRAADALEQTVDAAVTGQAGEVDVTDLLDAIDGVSQVLAPRAKRPSRPSLQTVSPLEGAGVLVRVKIVRESMLRGARAALVLNRMEAIGKVQGIRPAPVDMESDDFDGEFEFRLETEFDEEAIEREIKTAGDVQSVTIGHEDTVAQRAEGAAGKSRHIRIDLQRVDTLMNLIGELVTSRDQLNQIAVKSADAELEDVTMKVSRLTADIQAEIIQVRMTPVWQIFDRFPRLVRDLARQLGKQIEFQVEGKDIELDRAILDEIGDPLVHLLRNAVDHGIEPPEQRKAAGKPPAGRIVLSAVREKAKVSIKVSDDGRGIDRQKILDDAKQNGLVDEEVENLTDELLVRLLARPGFSTAQEVSDVSGRGVGIDVVATHLRSLGGGLEMWTRRGEGTTFTLQLPITLAIVRALTAEVGGECYVLPITHVAETIELDAAAIAGVDGQDGLKYRGDVIPLVDLRDVVDVPGDPPVTRPVVILQIGGRKSGLVVDTLTGQQEIVVKSFDPPSGTLPIFSGATILGDGSPVLILDAGGFV